VEARPGVEPAERSCNPLHGRFATAPKESVPARPHGTTGGSSSSRTKYSGGGGFTVRCSRQCCSRSAKGGPTCTTRTCNPLLRRQVLWSIELTRGKEGERGGAARRDRTFDARIFNPALYRLSYRGSMRWRSAGESNPWLPPGQGGTLATELAEQTGKGGRIRTGEILAQNQAAWTARTTPQEIASGDGFRRRPIFAAGFRGRTICMAQSRSGMVRCSRSRTCDLMLPKHARYQLRHTRRKLTALEDSKALKMASRAGVEPAIFGMKARCPWPLDERDEGWRARKESNPQPLALETSALPVELHTHVPK
jgi:hypothetical protein